MYSYFFTTANSCSNIKSIKCRLLKDSTTEYLVCLKSHSLDVYSLSNYSEDPNWTIENDSNYPLLVTSLNSYFTFLTFVEYRPPGHDQSHLLVLTQNYTLLLLTFDAENCKFKSKNVACLQEPFSGTRYGNIILKIDVEYNLIVFCGHSRLIKCIVLNKNNYFNFSDIIAMRTNDSFFLDIEFISTEYTNQNNLRSDFETGSSSFSTSLNKDLQFKSPNRNSLINYFECKLIVLGQDNNITQTTEPQRWLYGMHLFFEIELLNGYKRFNSYSNVALFGDPFKLAGPFSMFIPLRLNNNKNDSIMILGAGSVAYTSFKAPKQVKYFKLDSSITEVCCYLQYGSNKYLFADDNGNVYLMELLLGVKDSGMGLKRRVSSNINTKTVHTTKSPGEMTVQDVIVKRVGSCSIPSSIVKLNDERIFCGSKMGNSCTITLDLNSGNTNSSKINNRREWVHSNLGPITDFIYLQETYESNSSILACCGMGSSGTFSKIYFGIGSEVLYSTRLDGVSSLFSLQLHNEHLNQPCLLLCVSFYRFTRFYLIYQPDHKAVNKSTSSSFVDLFETKLSTISKLENDELLWDETTLLFTKLANGYILQVTPLNILLAKTDFKKVNSVEVSKLVNDNNGSKFIVSAIICGNQLLILLSNNTILLLDQRLNVVQSKGLNMSVASVTYISENDLLKSDFRESSTFKTDGIDGLLAVTDWDNLIVILSVKNMNILYKHSCNIKFGTFIKSLKFGMVGPEVYLLASVSDGKLNTYKLVLDSNSTGSASGIKIELENVIELSDKAFNLLDVRMNDNSETCDLSCRKIITTGNKCNIIHANNNKIEYTKVNINHLSALATLSNKWYSNPDTSQSLPRNSSFRPNMDHETLVVYYSNKNLVIGILDFVRNLNVNTILSGTNFNKIVYHHSSKLAAVSTIPQYIINPNYFNNKPDNKSDNYEEEQLPENGGKKRKMDTEFDSDLANVNRVLGGYSHQHQNLMICTDSNELLGNSNDLFSLSCLFFVDVDYNKVVHKLELPKGHIVSSLTNYTHSDVDYVAVGTSLVTEENDLPVDGYLYLIEIYKNAESFTIKAQRTTATFKGGIVDIAVLNQMLVLAVNATLLVFSLKLDCSADSSAKTVSEIRSNKTDDSSKLVGFKTNSVDKRYNFEYLGDCSEECNKCLELVTSYESNTYIVSIDVCDDSIFLGDLMTSVKLVSFRGNCLYESCRDFNTLWTSSLAAIDKFACLVSDDSGNFSIFSKSKNPVNDHKSIKFDTLGLFHHGETINKILKHNKITPNPKNDLKIATHLGQKLYKCNRKFCCSNTEVNHESFKIKEYSNLFNTIFTCCTSSGSFLQLCLFNDLKLFLKLSLLEQTLQLFHNDISVNFNKNYRNFENTHNTLPSKGFIDGDLIERFLKLPQTLKLKVFETFKQNSGQMELECNTLESLVADIENIHNNRLI